MNSIDWSKVPEGATHWSPAEGEHRVEAYWRPDKSGGYDCWAVCSGGGFWQTNRHPLPDYAKPLTPPVATWNGPEDGLPPVGIEVEFFQDGQWVPVRVMYVSEHTVLLKHLHDEMGDPEGAYTPHDAQFRPVRTAEQLAAKVRSKACDEIYGVLCTAAREGIRSDMAEALYDAGYRKVQP